MKKIIAGTSALALSLSMTSVAFAQTTTSDNIQLEVEVMDTLSMDCYDIVGGLGDTTVTLGTTGDPGVVTAGTPAVGRSRCSVTTNDDQGYLLSIDNSSDGYTHALPSGTGISSVATVVLSHEDPNIGNTWYSIPNAGLNTFDFDELTGAVTAGSALVDWDGTDPTGLGFSVTAIPEADNAINDEWGTVTNACVEGTGADSNLYAGVPNAPETIAARTTYSAAATVTDVCYKVDVLGTQQSGDYAGQVTFTATTDASEYIE